MSAVQTQPDGMTPDPHSLRTVVDDSKIGQHLRPATRTRHGLAQPLIGPATLSGEVRRVQFETGGVPLDRPDHTRRL